MSKLSEELISKVEPEKLYTVGEIAKLLSVKKATVRLWIRKSWLGGAKVGGSYRVEGQNIISFLRHDFISNSYSPLAHTECANCCNPKPNNELKKAATKEHFSFTQDKETGQIHTEPFNVSKCEGKTFIAFKSHPNKAYPVERFIFKNVFVSTSDGAFLNPVESFLEANCEITRNDKDRIPTAIFIIKFKQWLKENKMPLVPDKYIYSKMRELGFKSQRRRDSNSRRYCFLGVKFKTNWR